MPTELISRNWNCILGSCVSVSNCIFNLKLKFYTLMHMRVGIFMRLKDVYVTRCDVVLLSMFMVDMFHIIMMLEFASCVAFSVLIFSRISVALTTGMLAKESIDRSVVRRSLLTRGFKILRCRTSASFSAASPSSIQNAFVG